VIDKATEGLLVAEYDKHEDTEQMEGGQLDDDKC
jgi:hypothetical protein